MIPSNGQAWLQKKRSGAWESFSSSAALPFLRYGLDIVTPLEGFLPKNVKSAGNMDISSKDIQAARNVDDKRLFSLINGDRFSNLHMALCDSFLHLKIPDNTQIQEPILITKKGAFNHVFIDVGRNSSLTILESAGVSGEYHSSGTEIFLDEGASLVFGSTQHLSPQTRAFSVREASLERDARLEWVTIDTGGKLLLSRINGRMNGQGSSLLTKMMAYGSGEQHFDFDVRSVHAAPDTHSDIVQKAVLDGKAKMIINGMVKIQENAPRSVGYQKEDTLLLSGEAEASPIPNLEINNNDVKCSHGTTVGQIDKKMLFYAMSRGLDEETASRLVVKGFFDPLIASLPLERLQGKVREIVEHKLNERRNA